MQNVPELWPEGVGAAEPEVVAVEVQENVNNSVGGRVWNLVSPDAENPVKTGFVKISQISFIGYATPDDRCVVKDGRGNTVFEAQGDLELQPITTAYGEYTWIFNLTLAELTAGQCVVDVV